MVSSDCLMIHTTHLANASTGAVDMDIYGAFQLCSLGILAAPATVKNSRTYFMDPGRNIIFLWTGLVLSGKGDFFCPQLVVRVLMLVKVY